jgi:hypothetical protein
MDDIEGGLMFLSVVKAFPRLYDSHVRIESYHSGEWIETHRFQNGEVGRHKSHYANSGLQTLEWFEES